MYYILYLQSIDLFYQTLDGHTVHTVWWRRSFQKTIIYSRSHNYFEYKRGREYEHLSMLLLTQEIPKTHVNFMQYILPSNEIHFSLRPNTHIHIDANRKGVFKNKHSHPLTEY